MASLTIAGPSIPIRALNAGMDGGGNGKTRRMTMIRQPPRSSRPTTTRARFRRAYVNAPVHRASQHSRHRQALLHPTVHRSTTPRLSYGVSSLPSPLTYAAVVSAPPSLIMSTTVTAMAYNSSPQVSASAPPLVIRRGRSATPLFLQRTPAYPLSGSSGHQQPRHYASMSQFAPNRLPASTFNRASAPSTSSRSACESKRPQLVGKSSSSLRVHKKMDDSPSPSSFSRPSTGYTIQPNPTEDSVHLSYALSDSTSASVSPSSSPLPSLLSSLVLVDKELPPVPSLTEPPTPSEAEPSDWSSDPAPSRKPNLRPLSFDAEATIRELEELAASIMFKEPTSEDEALTASFKVYGIPSIEIGHGDKLAAPTVLTPTRPLKISRKKAPLGDSPQPNVDRLIPHIVVTNPSTENLAEKQDGNIRPPLCLEGKTEGGQRDHEEELQWVSDYGGWGTSQKGKWKAIVGDEECSDHESSPESKSTPLPCTSSENTYIYEPVGAPEFLVGCSSSPVVRATCGYHSRRPRSKRAVPEAQRARRRRPTQLALANPAQAEGELEALLANALFLGPAKPPRRPQTAPGTGRPRQPTMPSTWLTMKRSAHSNSGADAPPSTRATDGSARVNTGDGENNRRSEPVLFPSFSSHDLQPLRLQGDRPSESIPWPPVPVTVPGSEPNTPRPAARPRLKSLKGLFKHWSK